MMQKFTSNDLLPQWEHLPWLTFAWTSVCVRALRKTVTRRDWKDGYGNRFRAGDLLLAADRRKDYGGRPFGVIRLTKKPYKEPESRMPESDYEGEGFAYLEENPHLKPARWRGVDLRRLFDQSKRDGQVVWVVRFEVVELFAEPAPVVKPLLQERLL